MKLLIIEDDHNKVSEISLLARSVEENALIDVAMSVRCAWDKLKRNSYDLIVIDFMLPFSLAEGSTVSPSGVELLNIIEESSINRSAHIYALTAYPDYAVENREKFAASGVIVSLYEPSESAWKPTLVSLLQKVSARPRRRFVVVCALEKERQAFRKFEYVISKKKSLNGLDVEEIEIDGNYGALVLMPRVGLVNAAIITSLAIERFQPDYVCMPGICAGIKDRTEVGRVLVASPCWEYQVGKHTPTGFEIEPYQVAFDEEFRQVLSNILSDINADEIFEKCPDISKPQLHSEVTTFVSGSSVVASTDRLGEIQAQHRKLSGLDMEAYSVMLAANLANRGINVFAAKTVVDFADETKGDIYHIDGCYISAYFTLEIIRLLLSKR